MSLPSKRIALYIGDELYPVNGVIQTATIQALQASPLTSAILCLLNDDGTGPLVYNDPGYVMFDTSGNYIGPDNWPETVKQLRNTTLTEVYISFSTSGTDWMITNSQAMPAILHWIKNTLGVDGIDLDYEGSTSLRSNMYPLALAAIKAGLKLTAAPFCNPADWQQWVQYVQSNNGIVSWLNLQCYSGGGDNNPGDWNFIGVPIVAGTCPVACGSCTPAQIESLYMLWRTGYGSFSGTCWSGTPNTGEQLVSGGFFWAYSSVKGSMFLQYMGAMKTGLEGVLSK